MAEIFVRVHSPLFFCHFSSTLLQMRLSTQFTTFKSLFTPNVQIRVTLSLLNCSLFTLGVQILITLSLSNCTQHVGGPDFSYFVTCQLRPCHIRCPDPGHGTKICVHALATGSATVNLSWAYSGFNSTSLLFGTGCVDSSGSLSGGAFNQLKLVTLSIV